MKALVIGYGSIGARHARLLTELGCETAVVSKRDVAFPAVFHDLATALKVHAPGYVVVANETSRHQDTLEALVEHDHRGVVLVEKPLFNHCVKLPQHHFSRIFVAYNLRFHPAIQRLKSLLEGQRVLSALAYVGQYLPEWRPATDYRTCYSASAEQGGGVLRDLSHELDYLLWMLGKWEKVAAVGGHFSHLEISSDDICALSMATDSCPAINLQMNYLDRAGRRFILVNTDDHTIEVDIVKGMITVDRESDSFVIERDSTYRAMHQAVISGDERHLCSLEDGNEIMRLVEAIEHSAEKGTWVRR
ncbi:MAG: Gfo/Idh/MocA family oxidoreductase [Nitrosomonadales bacterium]|nr:Gfo/Idh/MocA family oxidoreductase [Nitrosomonadales bacterium]